MHSVSHPSAVIQAEDVPELLLLAHSPHVPAVLFCVALDGTVTQLRGNHSSNMTLRGFHVLGAHLVLLSGVRADNGKDRSDDKDLVRSEAVNLNTKRCEE